MMSGTVAALYDQKVAMGMIEGDAAQRQVAGRLDGLAARLAGQHKSARGLLRRLSNGRSSAARGLYVHGGVGRGKTMLMDMFFAAADLSSKRRLHFHEFMSEVHERIARGRATTEGDPIPEVAAEIAGESRLLCLDELQVTDIADAMILGRLFKGLFEREVILVTTSNAAPEDLYRNGLNRQLFVPFIRMLEDRLDVIRLDAAKDFRLDKLAGQQLYFTPADDKARAELDRHWERLTGHHEAVAISLNVMGRELRVPMAAMGVARFSFAELCERPLGANDYLHIAHAFRTVLIDAIPRLTREARNPALRFASLIDTLYDNRVCLIASAAAEPRDLFQVDDDNVAFERTASRLVEMQSEAYLAGGRGAGAAKDAESP
jgi:cell division protein ZapE